jgi:pyruvate formate-lyase/glycerol dehydratase family glycyl radical enzyme
MTTTIPKPGSISFEDRVTKSVPFEWGYGSTPRTAKLREEMHWKAAVVREFINVAAGIGKCTFREGQGIKVDLDRARLVTRSYKETEGQPWVIRRAKAVKTMCEEMPIFIKPGELVVGDANGAPDEIRWYPESCVFYLPEAVTTGGFSDMVTEEERKEIVGDIYEYWKDKCIQARVVASLPDDMRPVIVQSLGGSVNWNPWEESRTAIGYDYEVLFKEGLTARIEKAEAKLRELDSRVTQMNPTEYLEKKHNWEAMTICGRAIIRYAQRHAELARAQAKEERNRARKRELEEIAAILDRVPANPPRTFHECLQFYWIVEITAHYLAVCGNGCGVRIDQIWWPYYQADIIAGRVTRDRALELVECLCLKIQDVGSNIETPTVFTVTAGFDIGHTVNICGSDGQGRDLSNDLSCLVMEALVNLHINQPPIALRYHRNISPDVVERAIDLDRAGMGHPAWYNEELLEKWALMRGWSPEDAKNTQVAACVANHIKGKSVNATGLAQVGIMLAARMLEEVLGLYEPPPTQGRPELKHPTQMKSADEVLGAFCERLLFYARAGAVSWNLGHQVIMDYSPDPCNSFLLDEPLERGIDLTKLHKEHDTWPNIIVFGAVNLCDSLTAIQKLVFDDKKYAMDELLTALKANWQGYEEMRQDFLNAPKYGNEDEYADEWAVKTMTKIHNIVGQVEDAWGNPLTFDASTAAGYQAAGLPVGALPDGRFASGPLADGSISPMTGADKKGPTAVLNSAGKIPFMHTQLFNQRFMPVFLEGDNKALFAEYLREWYEKGTIPHIQFNVVDNKVLREAQEHPEMYTDLQVRVAGYSAFWVDLPPETQGSIIDRTEHSLV